METVKCCIRCDKCSFKNKIMSCSDIANLYMAKKLDIEFDVIKNVCEDCRNEIGNSAAETLLKESRGGI